ncbi:MAG: hypothetical protein Q8N60_04040, partial [Candidatus Diapherotrites archaeon]|nr:hypothetical protein [Candidatus Diapherotrites archaeon]
MPKKGKFPALEKAGFLIPTKVSLTEKRKPQRQGTDAFLPIGTELPEWLSSNEKRGVLRQLAHKAPFFVKKFTPRQRIIAEKLEAAGIKTEKPILILKNGRVVFEKVGHSLDSEQGKALFRRNLWENIKTLEEIVGKMHSLGITHNHLHEGNITIDEKGAIRIIDLGKATIVD